MVLVDTSILIDFLCGADNAAVGRFQYILDNNIPFGISPLTYLEVLQGTSKSFFISGDLSEGQMAMRLVFAVVVRLDEAI